jgi:hypothetical protein
MWSLTFTRNGSGMRIFVLLVSLALVSSVLVPMEFTALEISPIQKVVLFHDPTNDASTQLLSVLESIDSAGTYGDEYQFTVCDITATENIAPVEEAGLTQFPIVFTQTRDDGIGRFHGDFTVQSFSKYHAFRVLNITNDNVRRMQDSNGEGDVDGVGGLLEIAMNRPVLVKMYEVPSNVTKILEQKS